MFQTSNLILKNFRDVHYHRSSLLLLSVVNYFDVFLVAVVVAVSVVVVYEIATMHFVVVAMHFVVVVVDAAAVAAAVAVAVANDLY